MTESNPGPSRIIPNAYQTPNYFVDDLMRYLSGNEHKCVDIICRKTFGWGKRSDRISKSQLAELSGLGEDAIDECMAALVRYHVVIRMSENARNAGVEWAPQIDDRLIDMAGLQERDQLRREKNRKRTAAALAKRSHGGDVEHAHHVGQSPSGDVQHPPQKTIKDLLVVVNADFAKISTAYEQEFGALTPMIADAIQDAVTTYPPEWIPEAMQIAVASNKRSWKYVEGILKNCKAKNIRPSLNRLENSNGNNRTRNPQGTKQSGSGKADTPAYSDADRQAAERVRKRRAVPAV